MIVSFSSHPPRFGFLPDAINELARQTLLPSLVVVNVDIRFVNDLPPLDASAFPIEVAGVEDLGPATKLIPTMQRYPDLPIVTMDDDVIYRRSLLDELSTAAKMAEDKVVATMARLIPRFPGSTRIPYRYWPYFDGIVTPVVSPWLLPLGAEGVWYPPDSLHPDAFEGTELKRKSPTTDDLWFWIHRVRQGVEVCTLPLRPRQDRRRSSESSSLWAHNKRGVNVAVKNNLLSHYRPESLAGKNNCAYWFGSLGRSFGRRLLHPSQRESLRALIDDNG